MRKVRISSQLAGGALTSGNVIGGAISDAAVDTTRFISLNSTYQLEDLQPGDNGVQFGVAHSDYTDDEIEECLEASGSMDIGNKVAQEQANRLVRHIGVFTDEDNMFNDGKPVKTRLNWKMAEGDTLKMWIRNGSGTTWTTGNLILVQGELWITVR